MKKLFLTILLLLSSVSLSFGAIASTTVWEVRTTGDATNGGGFNASQTSAGTDYSQQDAAQLALTDLAMTTGGTTLTSATGGFTAAMIGNIIYIASGTNFTAGYYEITAYTDTNTVTLDRDATNGSNASGGSGKVGGALDNLQAVTSNGSSGNLAYVKSGTYTSTASDVLNLVASGITWFGYDGSRSTMALGDSRVHLDGETARTPLDANGKSDVFYGFIFERSNQHGVDNDNANLRFINCRSTNNASQGITKQNWAAGTFFLEIDNNGSHGADTGQFYGFNKVSYVYSHDNSGTGYSHRYMNNHRGFDNSIFESNSGSGLNLSRTSTASGGGTEELVGNIFYNNTGDGFNGGTGTFSNTGVFFNNLSIGNGDDGFEFSDNGTFIYFDYNAYYGNTGDALVGITAGPHDVTSDPLLTDPANGDFTLQSSSPLIGAGLDLSTFTSLTTDFNVNIGIDQGDHTTGGGSVIIIEGD